MSKQIVYRYLGKKEDISEAPEIILKKNTDCRADMEKYEYSNVDYSTASSEINVQIRCRKRNSDCQ